MRKSNVERVKPHSSLREGAQLVKKLQKGPHIWYNTDMGVFSWNNGEKMPGEKRL